ncbi:hypothetical protein M9H77_17904 [Catharanthus roseus]|uniref:Uncharacterized protein n=1 Tax=Catharanthus roseus TaxID=4058 RepID=A0ACC0B5Y4_CATRO|nr:hypothetical protein M9H77_17904 [Catharanthus roseus]
MQNTIVADSPPLVPSHLKNMAFKNFRNYGIQKLGSTDIVRNPNEVIINKFRHPSSQYQRNTIRALDFHNKRPLQVHIRTIDPGAPTRSALRPTLVSSPPNSSLGDHVTAEHDAMYDAILVGLNP